GLLALRAFALCVFAKDQTTLRIEVPGFGAAFRRRSLDDVHFLVTNFVRALDYDLRIKLSELDGLVEFRVQFRRRQLGAALFTQSVLRIRRPPGLSVENLLHDSIARDI